MRDLIRPDASFTPRELFARMQGAWFEPRQGYMWQEDTGVTPTTSGGQTIGLLIDQSGYGENNELASVLTLYAYDRITSYSYSNGDSSLKITWDSVNHPFAPGFLILRFNSVKSKTYKLTFKSDHGYTQNPANAYLNFVRDVSSQTVLFINQSAGQGTTNEITTYFIAKNDVTEFVLYSQYNGELTYNIKLESVKGNNASQSTAANRPIYQLDSNSLSYLAHDSTDSLSVALPDLGGGVFSSAGSVYFGVPQGMSALHNQSIGTTYNLPALQTDIYGVVITPARLAPPLEQRLALYMNRLAGLSDADFFWQEDYGPDVVTNGGFDTDSAWIKGIDWSISGGVASVVQNASFQNLTQECLTAGKVYIVTFTITQAANVSDGIRITLDGGTTFSAYYKTPGTYSFTAAATIGLIIFQNLNADISVDNISVREVLDGQVGQLLADDNDTILLRA